MLLTGNKSEALAAHSCLVKLLKWLTELRKTVYLLGYRVITRDIKRIQMNRPRDTWGEVLSHEHKSFCPHVWCVPPGSSPNPVLLGVYGSFIT